MATQSAKKNGALKLVTKSHRITSIGKSVNTRPSNKSARRSFKRYVGQGK